MNNAINKCLNRKIQDLYTTLLPTFGTTSEHLANCLSHINSLLHFGGYIICVCMLKLIKQIIFLNKKSLKIEFQFDIKTEHWKGGADK